MNRPDPARDRPSQSHEAALLEIIGAAWATRAVAVAAEIGVPDALAAGPASSTDIATRLDVQPAALHQVLRALATLEIVTERSDGRFELTERGTLLRHDVPGSLRAWAIWAGSECWSMWGHLGRAVRSGVGARAAAHGQPGFGHLDMDPDRAALFNEAMVSLTALAAPAIVRSIDWTADREVVDVGGGHGALLAEVLVANPGVRGVLLDLPHALDGARALLAARGVADRCRFQAGDFFRDLPPGATTYLLKTVLHDWDDARALAILRTCRSVLSAGARVLVIERLMPERMEPSALHRSLARSDLHMLAAHGAGERTEEALCELVAEAGLGVRSVRAAGGPYSAIELRRV